MADYLQKFTLVAGVPQTITPDGSIIAFDFTNDSPFDIDIAWGAGKPAALTVPPTTIWRGVKPSSQVLISGNQRSGNIIATPSYPAGGSPPNAPPAMQLTVHGYMRGNEPPESVAPLNRSTNLGNTVIQANQVSQTGQPTPTAAVQATPNTSFVGAAQETIINNDGTFTLGNVALPGNQHLSHDGLGNLGLIDALEQAGSQETGKVSFYGEATATTITLGYGQSFRKSMTNIPTSITLALASQTNTGTVTASQITKQGFDFTFKTPTANSGAFWIGTYTTAGN